MVRGATPRRARFPDAEAELAKRFQERRSRGRRVSERWFFAMMKQLTREMHPTIPFIASRGWFDRMRYRLKIATRAKTNCKQRSALERIPAIKHWYARYREMLKTPLNRSMKMHPIWGRFPPHLRFNCDQVSCICLSPHCLI